MKIFAGKLGFAGFIHRNGPRLDSMAVCPQSIELRVHPLESPQIWVGFSRVVLQ